MADEQMRGDHSGTDEAAGKHSRRAAQDCADDMPPPATPPYSMLSRFTREPGVMMPSDPTRRLDTGSGSDNCVKLKLAAVFESDGFGV